MKPELSYLAHNLCEIDKYRVETCCVIGESQPFYMFLLCCLQTVGENLINTCEDDQPAGPSKTFGECNFRQPKKCTKWGYPFVSFLSERTAVILSVQKVVEENIMKVHVADNAFIYSPETTTETIVCQV